MAERRTVLRDIYAGPGTRKTSLLQDYEGETEEKGFLYRIGDRIVRTNNDVLGAITGLPGQFRDNWRLLRDPVQLRLLARALVDDSLLTARRRKALFSMLLWGTLLIWGAVGVILLLTDKAALPSYQGSLQLFIMSLATSLLLPVPYELLLGEARGTIGLWWTVALATLGKVAGSYLVLLLGDKASEGLEQLTQRHAIVQKAFHAMINFAQKYGYAAVFVFFAIPFMPDTGPLYILALLRMKKLPFLLTLTVAVMVRSLSFLLLGDAFVRLFGAA